MSMFIVRRPWQPKSRQTTSWSVEPPRPKVIIPYARNRIAYAILKSLESVADCYVADSTRLAMCRVSRHAHGRWMRYPAGKMPFVLWARRQELNYYIFPTFEESWALRECGMLKNIVPAHHIMRRAANKFEVAKLCSALGIPAPESYHIPGEAVLKPLHGRGSQGRQYVKDMVFQQRVSGAAIGVGLLFLDGELVARCCWRRVSEYTRDGGWSVVRESIRSPTHEQMAEKLMQGLGWQVGACMVEFKGNHVIEVNPRLWGSLQLSIDAGVDFPRLMWDIITTGECRRVTEWKSGVMTSYLAGCLASHHKPRGLLEDWSVHDPLPFFMQFVNAGINLARHRRLVLDEA